MIDVLIKGENFEEFIETDTQREDDMNRNRNKRAICKPTKEA